MICINCGHTLNLKADISCPICGMKYLLQCTNCNEANQLYSKYCSNCGTSLDNIESKSSRKSSDILNESRRNVAVIFADISGFTALSEKVDPEEIREIINECFEYITKPDMSWKVRLINSSEIVL